MDLAPDEPLTFNRRAARKRGADGKGVLLIACGALAREVVALIELNQWSHIDVQCLPAIWHNTPERIPEAVRAHIRASACNYEHVFVLYGDCGTGGKLDAVLAEEGVQRIEGPHCYAFFSGLDQFTAQGDDDMTAFFLTDYLARHFDALVWQGLGLDRHPELLPDYFGNYTKVVYLAQTNDTVLDAKAQAAAVNLGLVYERRFTGYGDMSASMQRLASIAAE
jgi:Protein of unknown function (DUF1638)